MTVQELVNLLLRECVPTDIVTDAYGVQLAEIDSSNVGEVNLIFCDIEEL
jgi:hypothetical protein